MSGRSEIIRARMRFLSDLPFDVDICDRVYWFNDAVHWAISNSYALSRIVGERQYFTITPAGMLAFYEALVASQETDNET